MPYVWNLKRSDTKELTKQKWTHRLTEGTYACQGEGLVREFGIHVYTLLYIKWVASKDLLRNSGNSTLGGSLDGRGSGGQWIHVYLWLSPLNVRLKLSQHSC